MERTLFLGENLPTRVNDEGEHITGYQPARVALSGEKDVGVEVGVHKPQRGSLTSHGYHSTPANVGKTTENPK